MFARIARVLVIASLAAAGTAAGTAPANACIERDGPELEVNTYTTGLQHLRRDRAVARMADGGFLVVWESDDQDGSSKGIFARRYDADGDPDGGEIEVNTETAGSQDDPAIAATPDGRFVIAWENRPHDGDGDGVFARRFAASGAPAGSEFRVNTFTGKDQDDIDVAMGLDGSFVVVWESDEQDGSDNGVFGQLFDSMGDRIGAEFRANTYTTGSQSDPAVAVGEDGRVVVVWESRDQDGDAGGVFGQRFGAAGARIGAEFAVNVTTDESQDDAAIERLDGAGFVVAWESYRNPGLNDVFLRLLGSGGLPDGGEMRVNTFTSGLQGNPALAADSEGGFLVAWQSDGQDGSEYGVFARRFAADAEPLGADELAVNRHTDGVQGESAAAALDDGRFVVAWRSDEQDGSDGGVFAQVLAPAELCGDVNADCRILVGDALAVLRRSVGLGVCPDCLCDVDRSGTTSTSDALAVLRESVGLQVMLRCFAC